VVRRAQAAAWSESPSRRVCLFRLETFLSTTREVGVLERVRLLVNSIRVMRSHFNSWESAYKSGLAEKLSHLKFRQA
jgi:hypothetical protein